VPKLVLANIVLIIIGYLDDDDYKMLLYVH